MRLLIVVLALVLAALPVSGDLAGTIERAVRQGSEALAKAGNEARTKIEPVKEDAMVAQKYNTNKAIMRHLFPTNSKLHKLATEHKEALKSYFKSLKNSARPMQHQTHYPHIKFSMVLKVVFLKELANKYTQEPAETFNEHAFLAWTEADSVFNDIYWGVPSRVPLMYRLALHAFELADNEQSAFHHDVTQGNVRFDLLADAARASTRTSPQEAHLGTSLAAMRNRLGDFAKINSFPASENYENYRTFVQRFVEAYNGLRSKGNGDGTHIDQANLKLWWSNSMYLVERKTVEEYLNPLLKDLAGKQNSLTRPPPTAEGTSAGTGMPPRAINEAPTQGAPAASSSRAPKRSASRIPSRSGTLAAASPENAHTNAVEPQQYGASGPLVGQGSYELHYQQMQRLPPSRAGHSTQEPRSQSSVQRMRLFGVTFDVHPQDRQTGTAQPLGYGTAGQWQGPGGSALQNLASYGTHPYPYHPPSGNPGN
ncbi:hypothetical protein ACQY0O_007850 [Thecaphora frezii]